jgi:hypothetical protein
MFVENGGSPNYMEIELQIKMNPSLYLRDPEQSELGKNIIKHSIQLIHDNGFEAFTFKKLAESIQNKNVHMIGRLANYKYFNMDQAIRNALDYIPNIIKKNYLP